jgi:hypothetical protein
MPMQLPKLEAKRFMQCKPGELIRLSHNQDSLILVAAAPDKPHMAAVILGQPSQHLTPAELTHDVLSFGSDFALVLPPEENALIGMNKNNAPAGYVALVGTQWFLHARPYGSGIQAGYLNLQDFSLVYSLPQNEVAIYFRQWSLRLIGSDVDLFTFGPTP